MKDAEAAAAAGATLCTGKVNGIRMRWADTNHTQTQPQPHAAPWLAQQTVVVFLHGWPDSWFSWRHQLKAVAAAGYRGIAPDMRGYGGTEAPANFEDYNV